MNSGLHGFVIHSTMTMSTRKYAPINDSTYPGVSLHAHTPVGLAGGSVFFPLLHCITDVYQSFYICDAHGLLFMYWLHAAWDIPIDYIFLSVWWILLVDTGLLCIRIILPTWVTYWCFMLCDLLPLCSFMVWIDHLPIVCGSILRKTVLKDKWSVRLIWCRGVRFDSVFTTVIIIFDMLLQRLFNCLFFTAQISFKLIYFFQRHNQSSSTFTPRIHKCIISTYDMSVVYACQEVKTLSNIGTRGVNLCQKYHNPCSNHPHLWPICIHSSQRPPVVCTHSDGTFVWICIATYGPYSTVHSCHNTQTGTKFSVQILADV